MRKFLTGAAICALIAMPGIASATTFVLNLTGDVSNIATNSFTFNGTLYNTGVLDLSGFRPFQLQDGDSVDVTVSITGGAFTLPVRQNMFFGLNFADILGGALPPNSSGNGQFSFNGGPTVGAACGNCTGLISYQNNSPLSFTQLAATGTFHVVAPYDVNSVSVSYQVDGPAIPEPATWGLMISGFGMAGAMFRRQRKQGISPIA